MAPAVLLVEEQRDILRLLRSALDTLKNTELEIIEVVSPEAALQQIDERHVDVLVTDQALLGITGIELMHKVRARQPDIRTILITGSTDRSLREEMLNAGAVAVFSKPVPLGDFLDAVERGLGVAQTMLPTEPAAEGDTSHMRVSELLANLRQDLGGAAVYLISNRGLVVARAGSLRDSSMELSLMSALAAAFVAGMKVAASNHQDSVDQFSFFAGGDQDLVLMPVDAAYSMLLAGENLSAKERLVEILGAMRAVKEEVAKGLRSIGVTTQPRKARRKPEETAKADADLDALLNSGAGTGMTPEELDAYWDAAAANHSNKPLSKDVIPYEEARKMGLAPDAADE